MLLANASKYYMTANQTKQEQNLNHTLRKCMSDYDVLIYTIFVVMKITVNRFARNNAGCHSCCRATLNLMTECDRLIAIVVASSFMLDQIYRCRLKLSCSFNNCSI